MKKLTSLTLSLLITFFLVGCSSKPDGTYYGTCHNLTHGADAEVILIVTTTGNKVSGSINITGGLNGSAPISGVIDGDRISFTSDSGEGMPITWVGKTLGNTLKGIYSVSASTAKKRAGTKDQQGTWKVSK